MVNNKVIIALSALNVYELNRLQKFIRSPYFNKNDKLTSHFDYLFHLIKQDELGNLVKEKLWEATHPKKKFNDTKFRKLNTDLLRLIEEFLAIEGFQKNPLHKANYLLKAIAEKKIDKLYNSTINTVKRLSKNQLEKSASYYYYQYQIEKNIFNLTSEFERKTQSKTELSNFNITQIAENLDIFFLTEKMKYLNTLHTWQNVTKHEETIQFTDDLINQIKKIDYQSYPPLNIHYIIYLSTLEPDNDNHYQKLVENIEAHISSFPKEEAKDIFEAAINYCVRKANSGQSKYLEELFKLYNIGLDSEIMLVNGEITPTSFRNICFCSLRLQKYEWTENFINQYSGRLDEKYRDNAVTFNLARVYWYKKEFEKVIELLRDVEYEDILYNINSKITLLSVYYELDEFEAFESLVQSFKAFLRRQKSMPDKRRLNYSNFIKYTDRLYKIKAGDMEKIKLFRDDLGKETLVSSKFWLLEKAQELAG